VSLQPLTIIPAGAGSGKTFTIKERLGEWVVGKKVAPERIVAVTFTEAAAAELRERISAELIRRDRVEDALRLDQAYISTIHGFGLRILTEFAFEAGASPRPRLIDDYEKSALTRLAIARADSVEIISSRLEAFGYGYNFQSKTGPEEALRIDVLRMIDKLREIGWRPGQPLDVAALVSSICARYGPVEDGAALDAELKTRVEALLIAFPECLADEYRGNNTAREALAKDFDNLLKVRGWGAGQTDWKVWKDLRTMRVSTRGSDLPDGYDELAAAVMEIANRLPSHPGPMEQACRHIEALVAGGQDVLVEYEEAKRKAGLLDYGDMIAQAGELLRRRPDVLQTLVSRIDCLVIDEFQDTNPMQFALLWQLREAGVPTLVVGDLKQAIMGFQGADPRLFGAILDKHADVAAALDKNWRSQPALMEFINAVGPGLFGESYDALQPQGKPSMLAPLEVISFPRKAKKSHREVCAWSLGQRLKALLDDPTQEITDRHTRMRCRLRGGDIAVLCPTHASLAIYASVLRGLGLRVRLPADGWFASRPVQIACQALAYLANPADRHAALYLAVTELGALSLQQGLEQLMDTGRVEDPVLRALDSLAAGVADRTAYALVADVLSTLQLFDIVSTWPDGEEARANLLRLQAEAAEFMEANREALAYGGFHGSGVQTFIAWLAGKVETTDGDRQPEPRVLDEDAIVLSTWHSAKGREWPVVAVCHLDREIKAGLPSLDIAYDSFDDLGHLLDHARIEYSPKFTAQETNERFIGPHQEACELEARRLLYVAMTRARDKLILEWPAFLAGKDSATNWSILANDCQVSLAEGDGDDEVSVAGARFPCITTLGSEALPDGFAEDAEPGEVELPVFGRRAIRRDVRPEAGTPDSRTASGLEPREIADAVEDLEIRAYGPPLALETPLSGKSLGTFLHRCFEVLGPRPELATRLAEITGAELDHPAIEAIGAHVARFEQLLKETLEAKTIWREWPLLAMGDDGAVMSGIADLVIETPHGSWVIDHKSDRVTDPREAMRVYLPQLEAYAEMLERAGHTVAGVGVNWIRRGDVVLRNRR
jgi:ATP-dependent helicase/nuclease subunit A